MWQSMVDQYSDARSLEELSFWKDILQDLTDALYPKAPVQNEEDPKDSDEEEVAQYVPGNAFYGDKNGHGGARIVTGDCLTKPGAKILLKGAQSLITTHGLSADSNLHVGVITSPPWGISTGGLAYSSDPSPETDQALNASQRIRFFELCRHLFKKVTGEEKGFVAIHLPSWLLKDYADSATQQGFRILSADGGPWIVLSTEKPQPRPLQNSVNPTSQSQYFLVCAIGVCLFLSVL